MLPKIDTTIWICLDCGEKEERISASTMASPMHHHKQDDESILLSRLVPLSELRELYYKEENNETKE